jgi:DNA-binding beta-propeller fold protein YncE
MEIGMFLTQSLRRLGSLVGCCLIAGFLIQEAAAQTRIYAKVEPNIGDNPDKLNFDVNVQPDDNIAPNILFAADSKRGFVAYPGSGTVAFFSVDDGAILNRIKTGGKPFYGTRLPDGRTVLYTSVMDEDGGVIYVMDTQTPELLATYRFPNALFGFGSIIELSPDGATGYVSSTGTGELIKFNVADGQEIGRLGGMGAPAQVTVTPDGSTAIVVDVHNSNDEVVFVDTSSLTRKTSFKGPDDKFVNYTIFNKPVLSPDGTRGIIASRDLNGSLGADTIVYFDATTGALLDSKTAGSEPGFTTLTPDGQYWAILCEFTINLISTTDFKQGRDLQLVEGESIGSTNIVFTPDSRYAYYASSPEDLVFQWDLNNNAVVGQVRIGDNPNQYLDQPSTIARTPDGRAIAVVDFISNNIELLTEATVLGVTKYVSSAEQFTGLTLLNVGTSNNRFYVYAVNNFGELLT